MKKMLLLASAGLALAAPAHAVAQEPATPAVAAPDASGSLATYETPENWKSNTSGQVTTLTAPEGDLKIAIVDVGAAPDATAAATAAWSLFGVAERPVALVVPAAARDGWDERKSINYEVSPNEQKVARATTLRKGDDWTVLIVEGATSTAAKRSAAVGLVGETVRPMGYTPETFAGREANNLDAARIAEMRTFVEESIRQLGVPGVGYALIDDGKVVYEGGAGVRDVTTNEPVDADTLFMIGSNTKGMTTLLFSKLVDEGRLEWDQPVTEVYPEFRLGDDETTRQVLIRHLVCACTGLPRKDYNWIFNTSRETPAEETFTQLADTMPTSGFGEVYQYNNLVVSAAGFIGGHIVHPDMELGAAYDAAMQEKVFDPLDMSDTLFDTTEAITRNYAAPHGFDVDGNMGVSDIDIEYIVVPYRPAGGAWSSAHDMAKYVMNELTLGVSPDGERLYSEASVLKRREPNVSVGEDKSYGMGLQVDNSYGTPIVYHGGAMPGFLSNWYILPEAGVGAVLLTNADAGGALFQPFLRRLLEIVYDGKPEAAEDVAMTAERMKTARAAQRQKLMVPPEAQLADRLAPSYTNDELGKLTVRRDGDQVVLSTASWSTRLASKENADGTSSFVAIDPARLGFEFLVGQEANPATLTVRDGQHEYVFTPAS